MEEKKEIQEKGILFGALPSKLKRLIENDVRGTQHTA